MLYVLGKLVCSILLLILHPFNVFGYENMPQEGRAIIISNHKSNWDPIIIAMLTYRHIHYLGKIELFKHPLLNWFFTQVLVIPVDRANVKPRTIINCLKLLKENHILGIFPEGTRVRGKQLKPNEGFVTFAQRADAPIIPIHITGSYKLWHPLNVIIGKPIHLEKTKKKISNKELEAKAELIMDQLYDLKAN